MAEVKIAADSGGGSVGLAGPASTTSNAAVQLKLPVADGSANQHLKTDGSGALSWTTTSSGASEIKDLSDVLIEDNSIYVGQDPSSSTSTAEYNVSLGTTALNAVIAGDYNTAVGYNTLASNLNGTYNTGLGSNSLGNTTTSGFNTAVGSNSLTTNTTGQSNTGIGVNSLFSNVSGVENTGIGRNSLYNGYTIAYRYYNFIQFDCTATVMSDASKSSLHSNRDYEVGIVYMDEYGRASTVLTSVDNTLI